MDSKRILNWLAYWGFIVLVAACKPPTPTKAQICSRQENKPSQLRQSVNLNFGGSESLAMGQIFRGITSCNPIKQGPNLVAPPQKVGFSLNAGMLTLTAPRSSPGGIDSNTGRPVDFQDSISIQVETLCGPATANIQINVSGLPMSPPPPAPTIVAGGPQVRSIDSFFAPPVESPILSSSVAAIPSPAPGHSN